jgi:hypothetical protein
MNPDAEPLEAYAALHTYQGDDRLAIARKELREDLHALRCEVGIGHGVALSWIREEFSQGFAARCSVSGDRRKGMQPIPSRDLDKERRAKRGLPAEDGPAFQYAWLSGWCTACLMWEDE